MGRGFLTKPGAVTVTLASQNPLDRGGILSLSPLGLEKAIEGYFLRSEAKRKRVGRKRKKKKEVGEETFFEFAGSRMANEQEDRIQPKATKTKQQQNTNAAHLGNPSVPPFHTAISTTKKHPRGI